MLGQIKVWLKKFVKNLLNNRVKNKISDLIQLMPLGTISNIEPENNVKTIAFVFPGIAAFSGGTTSALRIGTYLEEQGLEVTYISYNFQSIEEMEKNAKINLDNVKGKYAHFNNGDYFDVVIATTWDSAYYVSQMNGYKMYFVQDFEPYFTTNGELFTLALKTYEFGYHMVSLGHWNKKIITKNVDFPVKIDIIEFPYDETEYHYVQKDFRSYSSKKSLQLVVYSKESSRRIPNIIKEILTDAKERFSNDGIDFNIKFFGGIENIPKKLGINLGKLSKSQLEHLYQEADFGLVASMTNISLVPYEMLATGLPIIEFIEGSYEDFLGKDSATLITLSGHDLYLKISDALRDTNILENQIKDAQERLASLSWEKTAHQFFEIIQNLNK